MLVKALAADAPDGFEFLKAANSQVINASNDELSIEAVGIKAVIEVRELPRYVGTPAAPFKSYPIMYFSRGCYSDGKWILQRMHFIPQELKHHASEQYERIYGEHGRKIANVWLDAVSRKYGGGL